MAFPQITALDSAGATQTINTLPNAGQAVKAESLPVAIASDDDLHIVLGDILTRMTEAKDILATQSTYIDGLEGILTTLNGYSDNVEGLLNSVNTSVNNTATATQTILNSIAGYVDTLETIGGNTNTNLTGIAALITTLNGYVDGLEALAAAPLAAGENHIGAVGGHSVVATASFNRPADTTAYAVGDLIANSVTAGSVTPMSLSVARVPNGTGIITRARLSSSNPAAVNTNITVHLFRLAPTVVNGDNGVFNANGVAAVGMGQFEVKLDRAFSDGTKGFAVPTVGGQIVFGLSGNATDIFALLEVRSAYTPASGETFTLELEVLRD